VIAVTVNPAISVSVAPPTATIDNGQTLTLAATASNGDGGYSYAWYSNAGCSVSYGGTASTQSVNPTTTTTYCIKATDSLLQSATATSVITVDNPTALLTVSNTIADSGQWQTLNGIVSGGVGPYTLEFNNKTIGSSVYNTMTGVMTFATNTFQLYSPTNGNVFYWNVIVIDTGSSAGAFTYNSPTNSFTVNIPISVSAISPTSPDIDSGQSITLTTGATGGNPPYTYQWYSNAGCTVTAPGSSVSQTYSATMLDTYCVRVTDNVGSTATATDSVTVNAAPSVSSAPGTVTYSLGSTITQTATIAGGTSEFTYNQIIYSGGTPIWSSNSPYTSTTTNEISIPYATLGTGTYTYNVIVKDSSGAGVVTFNTPTYALTLSASTLAANAITPASPDIDLGQSITLTTGATGGNPPYTYQWYSNVGCTTAAPGSSISQTYSATISDTYCVRVTDNVGSTATATDSVTVDNPTALLTVSNTVADSGQWQTLKGIVSGGVGPYTLKFNNKTIGSSVYNTMTGVTTFATNTFQLYSPTNGNVFYWNVIVIDTGSGAGAFTYNSPTNSFAVNSVMEDSSLSTTSATIDKGQSNTITALWTEGTPNYAVTLFSGTSQTCSVDASPVSTANNIAGQSTTFSVTPGSSTYYCIGISDSASTNAIANQITASKITVNPDPTISILPLTQSIDTGQSVLFTNTTLLGIPPYAWTYTVNPTGGVSGTGNVITFGNAGTFNVVETVTDNAGFVVPSSNSVITVNNNPSNPSVVTTIPPSGGIISSGGGLPTTTYTSTSTLSSTTIQTTAPTTIAPNNNVTLVILGGGKVSITPDYNTYSSPEVSFNFGYGNATFSVSGVQTTNQNVTIKQVNNSELNTPGYNVVTALKINLYTGAVVEAALPYNCNIPSTYIGVYVLDNGTWSKIQGYVANPVTCGVSFTVRTDSIVALLSTYKPVQTTTTIETVETSSNISNLDFAIVVAFIILAVIFIIFGIKRRKKEAKISDKKKKRPSKDI
jgi:hypothetical protein